MCSFFSLPSFAQCLHTNKRNFLLPSIVIFLMSFQQLQHFLLVTVTSYSYSTNLYTYFRMVGTSLVDLSVSGYSASYMELHQ